jgi:hypothetical protein
LNHRTCAPKIGGMQSAAIAAVTVTVMVLLVATPTAFGTPRDADLTAALAFWHSKHCERSAKLDASMWEHGARFNALFGNCRAADGHDQHVYFFDHGRLVGSDGLGTSSEVLGLWRDRTTFAFMYVLYRPIDALCCPTGGGAIVRFRWNGRRFQPLDKPPPRQNGTVPRGR